jgi:3'(2'), 5'-bisphosphate nucleotidase
MQLNDIQIERLNEAVREAGAQIKKRYLQSKIEVEYKSDKSPITIADREAHDIIINHLSNKFPEIPIISEEGDSALNLQTLKTNETYWLVDPIDGTRSFIRKKGDFTVNIGLINKGNPIYGVIYQPIKDVLYYTGSNNKAYKIEEGKKTLIHVNKSANPKTGLNIVIPTRHMGEDAHKFLGLLNIKSTDPVTSSFKFCLLAEGKYDLYSNFAKLNTWDIAAGHAILLAAGGIIYNRKGFPLTYANDSLRNPRFVAFNKTIGEDYIVDKLECLKNK